MYLSLKYDLKKGISVTTMIVCLLGNALEDFSIREVSDLCLSVENFKMVEMKIVMKEPKRLERYSLLSFFKESKETKGATIHAVVIKSI